MKLAKQLGTATATFAFVLAGCASAPDTSGTVSSAPTLASVTEAATIILENEYVRVTRVSLAAGSSLPTHAGERRAIYALSDYSTLWTDEDMTEATKRWSAGEVHFHEAGEHSLTNSGETDAVFLIVERLGEDLPAAATAPVSDAAIRSPATTELLAEDDTFRVLRVTLAPGEAQPMHGGRPRVIYSLSDYEIGWREVGEPEKTRTWSQGDVHWHLSGEHGARNTGYTIASWLIVSLKD